MKRGIVIILVLCLAGVTFGDGEQERTLPAAAEGAPSGPRGPLTERRAIEKFTWAQQRDDGKIINGQVVNNGPDASALLVENAGGALVRQTILVIERPAIATTRYALKGLVRHEGVEGDAVLEMRSQFSNGGEFFTRVALPRLEGMDSWREFDLILLLGKGQPPEKLELNVVLPGKGRVWIGAIYLVEYGFSTVPLPGSTDWWSDRQAALIVGIGGSVFCCLGGLIGILGGRGKARRFVMALPWGMVACGALFVAGGMMAFVRSRPYHAYYPLLLGGGLMVGISLGLVRAMKRRYARLELRKMSAMDAG